MGGERRRLTCSIWGPFATRSVGAFSTDPRGVPYQRLGIVELEVCRMEFVPDRTCECNWDNVDKVGHKALRGVGHPEEKCNELCAPAPCPFECETQLGGLRGGDGSALFGVLLIRI